MASTIFFFILVIDIISMIVLILLINLIKATNNILDKLHSIRTDIEIIRKQNIEIECKINQAREIINIIRSNTMLSLDDGEKINEIINEIQDTVETIDSNAKVSLLNDDKYNKILKEIADKINANKHYSKNMNKIKAKNSLLNSKDKQTINQADRVR